MKQNQVKTSLDMNGQKQPKRPSPFEYVVSLLSFRDIVLRKDRLVNQDTEFNMTEQTQQDIVKMLLSDKIHHILEVVEVPCEVVEHQLQGQLQDQVGFG